MFTQQNNKRIPQLKGTIIYIPLHANIDIVLRVVSKAIRRNSTRFINFLDTVVIL